MRENQMDHVQNARALREQLAANETPTGVYGDSSGGATFTDQESLILKAGGAAWTHCWDNGVHWTIINATPEAN
jgi:hypothetical protein